MIPSFVDDYELGDATAKFFGHQLDPTQAEVLGASLRPALESLAAAVTDLIEHFNALPPDVQQAIAQQIL